LLNGGISLQTPFLVKKQIEKPLEQLFLASLALQKLI
jgi:hypothetical protein